MSCCWDTLQIKRLNNFYASRREAGYYMQAGCMPFFSHPCSSVLINAQFRDNVYQRSFKCKPHKLLYTLSKVNFSLSMGLDNPGVVHRFILDLVSALTDWFARKLFCVLRRRAFRRQVRKRVAARLVLSKSRLADLPTELVRCICNEWL